MTDDTAGRAGIKAPGAERPLVEVRTKVLASRQVCKERGRKQNLSVWIRSQIFTDFCEQYAREMGCSVLRMDTNVTNEAARVMYKKLGFREAGIIDSFFNGIPGVQLVCLEKDLV